MKAETEKINMNQNDYNSNPNKETNLAYVIQNQENAQKSFHNQQNPNPLVY